MKILQGQRPDVTPAQLIAVLAAGVPIVASLLSAFGVYDLTPAQQDALSKTVQWAGLIAIGLFGADFGIRAARNNADAKVKASILAAPGEPPVGPVGPVAPAAPVAVPDPMTMLQPVAAMPAGALSVMAAEPGLPTDEEEFASVGPADGLATFTGFTAAANGDREQGPDSRVTPIEPEDVI
jgi:hypothetical protein